MRKIVILSYLGNIKKEKKVLPQLRTVSGRVTVHTSHMLTCGGQRTPFSNHVSPSIVNSRDIELRPSGFHGKRFDPVNHLTDPGIKTNSM